jgi:hypothetical protein
MIKILGLFEFRLINVQKFYIITHNYTELRVITRKKIKEIRYALLRLITASCTQSKFEKNKKNFFFINCYRVITRCYRLRRNIA